MLLKLDRDYTYSAKCWWHKRLKGTVVNAIVILDSKILYHKKSVTKLANVFLPMLWP